MGKAAREPYERRAKEDKERSKAMPADERPNRNQPPRRDIRTAQGVLYSEVEAARNAKMRKEESNRLRIGQLVENCFDLDSEFR